MSAVQEKGVVRNTIRGINKYEFYVVLLEMIDDAEHSKSKKVFVDLNTHENKFVIGFSESATKEQINNLVKWNTVSICHDQNTLSTCGIGSKCYEYVVRGNHSHYSYDETKKVYYVSRANSLQIYNEAYNIEGSSLDFQKVMSENTYFVDTRDEVEVSVTNIFENVDNKYPFRPKTVIISDKINNSQLFENLNNKEYLTEMKKELKNKYYHEVYCNDFKIYIKTPNTEGFEDLYDSNTYDIIGTTIQEYSCTIEIYQVIYDFKINKTEYKKGQYINKYDNKYYYITKKNGNSMLREQLILNEEDKRNIIHCYNYTQYNICKNDKNIRENVEKIIKEHCMVGKSLEDYSGIYLKMGNKFINSYPVKSSITKRNLPGAKNYRGVLEVVNPSYTKNDMQISGLKAMFDLSNMAELEKNIKQCIAVYKKTYDKKVKDDISQTNENSQQLYIDFEDLTTKSNKKTDGNNKQVRGHIYLLCVGKDFWKVGYRGNSNKKDVFEYFADKEYLKIKEDFPEEEIYSLQSPKITYFYLNTYPFKNAKSLEQMVIEYISERDDVTTYDSKQGNSKREYFNCKESVVSEIRDFIYDNAEPLKEEDLNEKEDIVDEDKELVDENRE